MTTEINHAATFYSEIENDSEILEKNVEDFPTSSLARFLLLYHYKKYDDPRFEEFSRQTAIYLYNPLWTQLQLARADESGNIYSNIDPYENLITDKYEPLKKADWEIENIDDNIINNTEKKDIPQLVNEQTNELPVLDTSNSISPNGNAETIEVEAIDFAENPEINDQEQESTLNTEPKEITANDSEENDHENEVADTEKNKLSTPVNEQINENFILGIDTNESENDEDLKSENEKIINPGEEVDLKNDNSVENDNLPVPEIKPEDRLIIQPNSDSNPVVASNEETTYKKVPEDLENIDEDEDEDNIEFEPLHTVDYFASQGIKIPEEALENDSLGKQVKSFTAWLKSMKKLHPDQLPEQNEVIERIIQTSSEASNQNAHVLTEAMAEVLIKQGKQGKAIEMYQKLSLINPSKSAYFAAKIENLKII